MSKNNTNNDVPEKANEGTASDAATITAWLQTSGRKVSGKKDGDKFVEVAQALLLAICTSPKLQREDLLKVFKSGKFTDLIEPKKTFDEGRAKSQFKKNDADGQRGNKQRQDNAAAVRISNLMKAAAIELGLDFQSLTWGHMYQTAFMKESVGPIVADTLLRFTADESAWTQSRTTANMSKVADYTPYHDVRLKCCLMIIKWAQSNKYVDFIEAGAKRNGFVVASSFLEFNEKGRKAWAKLPDAPEEIMYEPMTAADFKLTKENIKTVAKVATPINTRWITQCWDHRKGDVNAIPDVKATMEGFLRAMKEEPAKEWDLFKKDDVTVAKWYKWFAFVSTTIRNMNGEGSRRGGANTRTGGTVSAGAARVFIALDMGQFKKSVTAASKAATGKGKEEEDEPVFE